MRDEVRFPSFDFRGMCLAGLRAAEAVHAEGLESARCPVTGTELRCDEFGIWFVAAVSQLIGVDLAAPGGDWQATMYADGHVERTRAR